MLPRLRCILDPLYIPGDFPELENGIDPLGKMVCSHATWGMPCKQDSWADTTISRMYAAKSFRKQFFDPGVPVHAQEEKGEIADEGGEDGRERKSRVERETKTTEGTRSHFFSRSL